MTAPRPKPMPPSICAVITSGLMAMPQSTAQTTRSTVTCPAASTVSSATCATKVLNASPTAMPRPLPAGNGPLVHPAFSAASSNTANMRGSCASKSRRRRTLSGKVFPQPPLVFKVCGSELSVRALTENRRPRPETTLTVAPYWNCDRHGGRVCQGSMRVPGSLCLAARQEWENAFFQSEFTHAALGAQLTTHPEGYLGLWRDLTGSEGEFPVELLINSGESLRSFVHAREE